VGALAIYKKAKNIKPVYRVYLLTTKVCNPMFFIVFPLDPMAIFQKVMWLMRTQDSESVPMKGGRGSKGKKTTKSICSLSLQPNYMSRQ
jgi:hypothetical protein